MNSKMGWVNFLAIGLIVMGSGCGGEVREKPSPPSAASSESAPLVTAVAEPSPVPVPSLVPDGPMDYARAFHPLIVQSSESDPTLPGTTVLEDQVTASEDIVIFNRVVALPDGTPQQQRPLFLIWDRAVFDSPVLNAFYSKERWDVANQRAGERVRLNAWQDPEHKRWYIPLASLIEGLVENVDSAETHWAALELQLESGSIVFLNIGIRFQGPVPSIRIEQNPVGKAGIQPAEWVNQVGSTGWTVLEERYTNPSLRDFSLWFRNVNGTMRTQTRVDTIKYARVPSSDVIQGTPLSYFSKGHMDLTEIQVIRKNGAVESFDLKKSGPIKIRFNALETLTVKWIATRSPSSPRCFVPSPMPETFRWVSFYEAPPKWPCEVFDHACNQAKIRYDTRRMDATLNPKITSRIQIWSIRGLSYEADLNREVWLGEASAEADPAELEKPPTIRSWIQLMGERKTIKEGVGEGVRANATPFSCQGVF